MAKQVLCVATLTIAMALSASGTALSQKTAAFRVRLPAVVRAQEPVEVTFVVENMSDEDLTVNLGWNRIGALAFNIIRPDGTSITVRPTQPPLGGIRASSDVRIEAGKSYTGWILLNEWADLSATGVYTIAISSDAKAKGLRSGAEPSIDSAWATTLRVDPTTDADVRALCERLVQQIMDRTKTPFEIAQRAAISLAGIRHKEAIPYLEAIARDVRWASIAVPALGRSPEPSAVEALQNLVRRGGDAAELAADQLRRRKAPIR